MQTSPVLCCRRATVPNQNVRGTVGLPIPGTQVRVVNPETHVDVPDGTQGLLLVRGPGVMNGYYRDELATSKVFTDDWFDTGDLGWRIPSKSLATRHVLLMATFFWILVQFAGHREPNKNGCFHS